MSGEHGRARLVIDRAKRLLHDQFDALRLGGRLDIKALTATTRQIAQSVERNRFALIGLSRIRDRHEYTYVHSVAVSALMVGLARELCLDPQEVELLGLAGLLHDIGKSKVPVAVLDKPGPLDDDEWQTIRTHPERGHAILRGYDRLHPIVLDVALHHHERFDGSGYPHAQCGPDISLHARIAAICDVYDALTSKRAYKDGRPPAVVLAHMQRSNAHFDPALLRVFRHLIGAFPAGAIVRLQSGRLGIVLDEIAADPLSPRVVLVHDTNTGRALDRTVLDTATDPILSTERAEDWPSGWLVRALD